MYAQSNTYGLPEGCCYQAERQRYWDQAVLANFGFLAQLEKSNHGNIAVYHTDTTETPEGVCPRRKDPDLQ